VKRRRLAESGDEARLTRCPARKSPAARIRRHLDAIETFVDAGFDHVYLHQVDPDQAGFMEFVRRELLTAAASTAKA
jgi:hypothetical protein